MAKASCALQTLPALGSGSMGTAILAQQFLFARAQSLHVQGRMWQCCVWVIPALLWTFPKTATNKNCDHHPNLSTVWCSHMCSCVHVALIYVVRGLQHGAPVYVMHGPNVVLLCTRFMVHGPQHGAPVSLHMKRARPLCGCSWRSCQGIAVTFTGGGGALPLACSPSCLGHSCLSQATRTQCCLPAPLLPCWGSQILAAQVPQAHGWGQLQVSHFSPICQIGKKTAQFKIPTLPLTAFRFSFFNFSG